MSTDLRTAAQQALEALESLQGGCTDHDDGTVEAITVWCPEVIDALRAALAQPAEQGEPLSDEQRAHISPASLRAYDRAIEALPAVPPRRTLTDEQIDAKWRQMCDGTFPFTRDLVRAFARAVLAAAQEQKP